MLESEAINFMYGIEGGTALHFIDEKPYQSVQFKKNKHAYHVTYNDSRVIEVPYRTHDLTF